MAEPVRIVRIFSRLNIGGPAIHVLLLTSLLDKQGFETTLVVGRESGAEGNMLPLADKLGIKPEVVSSLGREIRPLSDLRAFWSLYRLLRRVRPQIVHTHTAKAGFLGRAASLLAGVPIIIHTFHGHVLRGYFGNTKTRLFLFLERFFAKRSAAIVAVGERVKEDLVELGVCARDHIQVIPLGFDLEPFENAPKGELRSELKAKTSEKLVGIIGRLVPIKNHELFLEAAQKVAGARKDVRFLIIGDGELRRDLETRVREKGLDQTVQFLGWRRDLAAIYPDLDVVVLTSLNEGTPVSLIESLASGTPVVSTNVGGVADVVPSCDAGLLVPSGDVDQLAQAIGGVLDDPDRHRAAALHHAPAIRERYRAERLARDVTELYRRLLARD